MKKPQWILAGAGALALVLLLAFGKTVKPHDHAVHSPEAHGAAPQQAAVTQLSFDTVLARTAARLNPQQQNRLLALNEQANTAGEAQKAAVYQQISRFLLDTLHQHALGAYYLGQAGSLENSGKKLTFAARLLFDELMQEPDPAQKQWEALQAKAFFDKVVALDPANDSAQVAIGALYMFGGISANPMEGILKVRQIAEKNPRNVYAQMVLGMGGIQSGQYDRAIDRFKKVIAVEPNNLEAIFHLAETYDRKSVYDSAVLWYTKAAALVKVPQARQEIEQRISTLRQQAR